MNPYDAVYRFAVRPLRTRKFVPQLGPRIRRAQEALQSPKLPEVVSQRLNALAIHAAKEVPFWRRRFADAGINPHSVTALGDLRRLPILEKSEIRENLAQMVSTLQGQPSADMTGGSTAAPMRFFRDAECLAERVAHEWVFMNWYGRAPHHRWAHIWGSQRDIGESASLKSRWRSRLLERSVVLPANALSPQRIDDYLLLLQRFKPQFIHAYSQGAFLVARRALERGWTPPVVKAATVTAEPISPEQKNVVSQAFECPTFSIYGTREFGMIAAEHPFEPGLQINPLNAVVEILGPDGQSAPEGMPGQVVVTDLLNKAMPLIRYRIGDVAAALAPGRLGLPRIDIVAGRETDFVVTPDGRFVSGASLTLVSAPGVAQLQYIQEAEDELTVRYIRAAGFSDDSLVELRRRLADVLGSEIECHFIEVDDIPLLPSGKLQYVRSEVSRTRLACAADRKAAACSASP